MKRKSSVWTKLFSAALAVFTLFVMLDTFIIPRSYTKVEQQSAQSDTAADTVSSISTGGDESAQAVVTDSSYSDGNITITLTQYREYDTDIYVADITVSSAAYLKTALAESTFGRNITEKTSVIASEADAILAINGDYYGTRSSGYVIRNGVIYRETASDSGQEDLVIYSDGSFEIVEEGSITAQELLKKGAQQVLSFGPGLIENGEISVSAGEEVDKSQVSNPRTAIGQIGENHYVFVVSDGRTSQSEGLSLVQLAQFMQKLGVNTAYNLDGGGSSTLVFNGTVINNPTTNGKSIKERSVSDIVLIGY